MAEKRELASLAGDARTQSAYPEAQGIPGCVDEPALDYDAIAVAAHGMFLEGEITPLQRDAVRRLNDYRGEVSGQENARLWGSEAVHAAEQGKGSDARPKAVLHDQLKT